MEMTSYLAGGGNGTKLCGVVSQYPTAYTTVTPSQHNIYKMEGETSKYWFYEKGEIKKDLGYSSGDSLHSVVAASVRRVQRKRSPSKRSTLETGSRRGKTLHINVPLT